MLISVCGIRIQCGINVSIQRMQDHAATHAHKANTLYGSFRAEYKDRMLSPFFVSVDSNLNLCPRFM